MSSPFVYINPLTLYIIIKPPIITLTIEDIKLEGIIEKIAILPMGLVQLTIWVPSWKSYIVPSFGRNQNGEPTTKVRKDNTKFDVTVNATPQLVVKLRQMLK